MILIAILFIGLLLAFSLAVVLAHFQKRGEQRRLADEYQRWVREEGLAPRPPRPPKPRPQPRRTVEDALKDQRRKALQPPKKAQIIPLPKKGK